MKLNIIRAFIFTSVLAVSASAQTVGQRRENQQDRIGKGVTSGRLTARESSRLERREGHINREIRRDRGANGGHLTAHERSRIQHRQNRVSRSIYRDKHNNRVQ